MNNFIAALIILGLVSFAESAFSKTGIRIIAATFGDQVGGKTCTPDLSLCHGLATCSFTVGEMCKVESKVKNLEVTWDCGDQTEKLSRAAAQGTKISLACEK